MRREDQYLPDPPTKPSKERIDALLKGLREHRESYCQDKPHEWKYWGGTRGLKKLRSCRICYRLEIYTDNEWICT